MHPGKETRIQHAQTMAMSVNGHCVMVSTTIRLYAIAPARYCFGIGHFQVRDPMVEPT